MATIETREITKRFEGHTAVDHVDLRVADREFMVLVGPSGCGKTTLLRMLAGLETPTSGEVVIGGRVVTHAPPRARDIAMVFQNYALYPHLSVFKNIAFPLRAAGVRGRDVTARVERAAARFAIDGLLRRKPRQLSGGERQRVALARAVVREPVVFLLDEPLSNLDAKLRTSARHELQQLQRQLGTTTVYVTHDQVEAMGLGDRIVLLESGHVHQVGTPAEIYADPADTFVATFLGSHPMNLVRTAETCIGVRPEHLLPQGAFAADEPVRAFPLRVQLIEDLGADRLIYGTLEPPHPPTRVISRLPSLLTIEVRPGERHAFAAQTRNVKRFALDTGRKLAAST
ncbi:MAG: ATP-binding cassette domain-containing protein [Burkholderiales bacterium]|nr:ATP-binding cassette domain-containing protein [Burkholderiales bacterium]